MTLHDEKILNAISENLYACGLSDEERVSRAKEILEAIRSHLPEPLKVELIQEDSDYPEYNMLDAYYLKIDPNADKDEYATKQEAIDFCTKYGLEITGGSK